MSNTTVNLACIPQDTTKVCKLSGSEVRLKKAQLLTLRDCEKMLAQSEQEAIKAIGSIGFWRKAELAARIALVACDAAIMVLEDKTGLAGIAVSRVYSGGKLLVDALNNNIDNKKAYTILAENHATIAEKTFENLGKESAGKVVSLTKNLLSLADTLWEQLNGANAGMDGASGVKGALTTVTNQIAKIRFNISAIEAELENC